MFIEGKQIGLTYGIRKEQATVAFQDVDITLESGKMAGIIGPSGSGKSSLLYVLSGLKKPTSGTVYYDDADIEGFADDEKARIRRLKFGFIFQRHYLIEYLPVLDNVLTGVNSRDAVYKKHAMDLLERLGIATLYNRKPWQLSGGQRQRAAVVRALVHKPAIVFADEPTASMDHKNAEDVMNLLDECRKNDGMSVLVVTHDRSILDKADYLLDMWDGRLKS
ncbi:MAG: ABC transporter ATP-binding protein [Clostridiaceae bacterium]|nr:ABC transporter ATP-binding protein [Clostridiaceae bacterium]